MTGPIDIYVHGLPGSPAEARLGFPPGCRPGAILAPWQLGDALHQRAATGEPVARILAFSLGAHTAIEKAARHPDAVRELVLVSPAAPLQLGDFLPLMAGAPMFRAARTGRVPLAALTLAQSLVLRIAPDRLIEVMFARTAPSERALLDDPSFRQTITEGLRASLIAERSRYLDAVLRYVADWTPTLARVRCPVAIVHGEADAWAPPAMAIALAERLGGRATLTILPGTGHYGALRRLAEM